MSEVGQPFHAAFEIVKRDNAQRIIYGVATAESPDKTGDIMDYEGSLEALSHWPGNIREQHDPKKVVGKCFEWHGDPATRKIHIALRISKSRDGDDAWLKVREGILTGLSVKGPILSPPASEIVKMASGQRMCRRIRHWRCDEISLVDNPAHQDAGFTLVKAAADGGAIIAHLTEGQKMTAKITGNTPKAPAPSTEAADPGAVVSGAAEAEIPAAHQDEGIEKAVTEAVVPDVAGADVLAWGAPPKVPEKRAGADINKPAAMSGKGAAYAQAAIAQELEKALGGDVIAVPGLMSPLIPLPGTGYLKFAIGAQQGALLAYEVVKGMLTSAVALDAEGATDALAKLEKAMGNLAVASDAGKPATQSHAGAPVLTVAQDVGKDDNETQAGDDAAGASTADIEDGADDQDGDDADTGDAQEEEDAGEPETQENAANVVKAADGPISLTAANLSAIVAGAVKAALAEFQKPPATVVEKAAPRDSELTKALGSVQAELDRVKAELEVVKSRPVVDPHAPSVRQVPGVVAEDKTIGGMPGVGVRQSPEDAELGVLEKMIAETSDPYARQALGDKAALLAIKKVHRGGL